jgi:hypothetical protein
MIGIIIEQEYIEIFQVSQTDDDNRLNAVKRKLAAAIAAVRNLKGRQARVLTDREAAGTDADSPPSCPAESTRFALPAAIADRQAAEMPAEIANFIIDTLHEQAVGDRNAALFFGEAHCFFAEYYQYGNNDRHFSERRSMKIDEVLGAEAADYIIEDVEYAEDESTDTNERKAAVTGIRRAYLTTLTDALKKRGYLVQFAGSARIAGRDAAETDSETDAERETVTAFAIPRHRNYLFGGSGKRRFADATRRILIAAVAVIVILAVIPPAHRAFLSKETAENRVAIATPEYADAVHILNENRALIRYVSSFDASEKLIAGSRTGYAQLLETLGGGLISGAAITEAVYDTQSGLIIDCNITDVKAFERQKSVINDSRVLGVAELATREAISAGTYRVQIKIDLPQQQSGVPNPPSADAAGNASGNGGDAR